VNEPLTDDERLAAFLDGRMDERERAAMLARLGTDDEAYEVFAHTAAVLRRAEAGDAAEAPAEEGEVPVLEPARTPADEPASGDVISLAERAQARTSGGTRGGTARRTALAGWMALAAVLATVALVAGLAWRSRSAAAGYPVRLAARLEHGAEGLPAGWTEGRPWSARGGDPGGARSSAQRFAQGAQAGAMLVDLSVAIQARDAAATRVLAAQIAGRFDRQGGRSSALRTIVAGAGESPERLRPLVGEATGRIAKRLDGDALRLGAWTEAAGLAAERHDAGFFRDGETRTMLDRAERLTADDPPARAAVQQVRPLVGAEPLQWEALSAALDTLAGALTSE